MASSICFSNIELYETKTRLYAIGREGLLDRYRVLKFDRTLLPPSQPCFNLSLSNLSQEELGLMVSDDGIVYTQKQIFSLLKMLEEGNGSIHWIGKCFGLLGVTRFLEGYYLITIIRTTRWILLGSHTIYRVDETRLIPLANPSLVKIPKKHEEQQYLTAFQTLILQHDFYFSPTYDLSKTLQCNVLKRSGAPCSFCSSLNPHLLTSSMYTWNSFLIQLAMQTQSSSLDPAWFVTLIQGFIGQIQMDLLGRRVYVTLIARRSRKFAGARFLRRGLDGEGYVANEVETEQIVHLPTFEFPLFETKKTTTPLERCPLCDNHGIASDGTTRVYSHSTKKFIKQPCFTSFVQHRGSIPLLWSQENGTITPKPPITLNIRDPYFVGASLHFNRMLEHYGTPIIILNLIKSKESFKREAILGEEFEVAIKYLNQFLGFHEQLEYHHVDMSHHAKSGRVMDILEAQVEKMVDKVGFFANSTEPILHAKARGNNYLITGRRQSGVIRTNCIDCLDRTNAAAFVIGKAALERQLLHLGILDTPQIDFDSEAVSLLMNLYQEHGDAIAFQYAGSNLVNTMSTYRKGNFVSQSRDLLETIKRYYSSSFTDSEKQDTIDIFLGLGKNNYKPSFKKIKHESYHSNWRKHSDPLVHIPRMDLTASEENIANGALEYVSLVEILGRECPSSQTDSPFKTRSYNESTMFALGGLKKWITSQHRDSASTLERSSSNKSINSVSKLTNENSEVDAAKFEVKKEETHSKPVKSLYSATIPNQSHHGIWPEVNEKDMTEYKCYLDQFKSNAFLKFATRKVHEHPDFWIFKKALSIEKPNVPIDSQRIYKSYLHFPEKCIERFASSLNAT